jgi:hypothetical protein
MFLYLVGDCGPEHNSLHSIHLTYKGAVRSFNKLRYDLIDDAVRMFDYSLIDCDDSYGVEMYSIIIQNLSEMDPIKIDNYPQDTPYIRKMKLSW